MEPYPATAWHIAETSTFFFVAADKSGSLFGCSYFKDVIANKLRRLFNLLHLLADSCARCLVAAFSLVDIGFDFAYQSFEVIILLHQIFLLSKAF